ncbi:uncharacterized protein BO96DRAFT_503572 [Aspergillus niger CBS 101883]|uniref:uncharacterized protein n=1 Tax=Aspergillus lacticoffeatus (strain CBS 101883) TaxID=1450533 RepID=UPI000D7EFCDE|nr:uncharacterized protein BO96DRAFT_503572 [Aspergillus niger CBS 101883]PYH52267.1 hypothetical protein BO96DRAFT_503572 [Aspergillus niger CBS 101883]
MHCSLVKAIQSCIAYVHCIIFLPASAVQTMCHIYWSSVSIQAVIVYQYIKPVKLGLEIFHNK